MSTDDSPARGLGVLPASLAFALGSLLALFGATEFATQVHLHVVRDTGFVTFDSVFLPALAFLAGTAVAFSAFFAASLRIRRD
ncbi:MULTISPECIES: hypothetical protein [Halorussus]|uniref:hypothetical protein n=1 Tax=Halorussus TaxID=1070314 RepID=UPI00209FD3BC|nr:hypothetical protein [Halorussus vallis]USZ77536.1 hypothetical protein NGM07_09410 [Halorussus vallis]